MLEMPGPKGCEGEQADARKFLPAAQLTVVLIWLFVTSALYGPKDQRQEAKSLPDKVFGGSGLNRVTVYGAKWSQMELFTSIF